MLWSPSVSFMGSRSGAPMIPKCAQKGSSSVTEIDARGPKLDQNASSVWERNVHRQAPKILCPQDYKHPIASYAIGLSGESPSQAWEQARTQLSRFIFLRSVSFWVVCSHPHYVFLIALWFSWRFLMFFISYISPFWASEIVWILSKKSNSA